MNDELQEILRELDTPTVCNAIEMATGSRSFSRFTKVPIVTTAPFSPPIVGRALTATIRAKSPPSESREITRNRRMEYYRYMAEGAKPAVAVIQDLDSPEIYGAYWGEINATVHRAFGLSGALTDGQVRDLDVLPQDFPIIAGAVGVSHAFVHVVEYGISVEVFGMKIDPGEWIHADRHGAVVIPDEIEGALEQAIGDLTKGENLVLEPARHAENYDFETFRASWEAFEAQRT